MTQEQIETMRKLYEATTQGIWWNKDSSPGITMSARISTTGNSNYFHTWCAKDSDANFIVCCNNLVPELLDLAEWALAKQQTELEDK